MTREERRAYDRAWIKKPANRAKLYAYAKKRYHSISKKYLKGKSCVKCGSLGPLEFHHLDRKTKVKNVTGLFTGDKEKLHAEIKKCQILCESCHKIETKSERERPHGTRARCRRCNCDICKKYRRASGRKEYWKNRTPVGKGGINKRKTKCVRGHQYNKSNTRFYVDKDGYKVRRCKACYNFYELKRKPRRNKNG